MHSLEWDGYTQKICKVLLSASHAGGSFLFYLEVDMVLNGDIHVEVT
jgi:hypothetical protein